MGAEADDVEERFHGVVDEWVPWLLSLREPLVTSACVLKVVVHHDASRRLEVDDLGSGLKAWYILKAVLLRAVYKNEIETEELEEREGPCRS